ncbi:hypothetical protein FA95DRAFT_684474 [Auriscalpium vulgare]|uniref:Uncharacterized protein n=1 Tax=Auriscalpium vulgare TaxID=40419 RepID=A0ACB8S1U2_9AGAM|nr:hypothetical protein FA95DRAFT_684474 [Auriscalpium vulgare]
MFARLCQHHLHRLARPFHSVRPPSKRAVRARQLPHQRARTASYNRRKASIACPARTAAPSTGHGHSEHPPVGLRRVDAHV